MTELQFLIDLFLNQRLSPTTRKIVGDRIGFVEESLRAVKPVAIVRPQTLQAPSTQALMEKAEAAALPASAFVTAPVIKGIPPAQRIVGGEVITGNGTKGPRKF